MNDRQRQQHHSVRRIVLPSGRSIEVVRFHETEQPLRDGLHVCPECDSELVQPLAWSEAAEDRWELVLECPNCRWSTEGVFTEEQVTSSRTSSTKASPTCSAICSRLAHANMADQSSASSRRCSADLILPEDF